MGNVETNGNIEINGCKFDFQAQAKEIDGKYYLGFDEDENAKIVFDKFKGQTIENHKKMGRVMQMQKWLSIDKLNGRIIELKVIKV